MIGADTLPPGVAAFAAESGIRLTPKGEVVRAAARKAHLCQSLAPRAGLPAQGRPGRAVGPVGIAPDWWRKPGRCSLFLQCRQWTAYLNSTRGHYEQHRGPAWYAKHNRRAANVQVWKEEQEEAERRDEVGERRGEAEERGAPVGVLAGEGREREREAMLITHTLLRMPRNPCRIERALSNDHTAIMRV